MGPGHKASASPCGFEKNGYIATCAQVAVEEQRIRILRVVEAFDCGAVVNPDHLKNQIQGAISMALGGALFEQIRFGDGQVLNPRFSQYRVPRFSDMPGDRSGAGGSPRSALRRRRRNAHRGPRPRRLERRLPPEWNAAPLPAPAALKLNPGPWPGPNRLAKSPCTGTRFPVICQALSPRISL